MEDSGKQNAIAPQYRVGWAPFIPRILVLALLYGAMMAATLYFGDVVVYLVGFVLFCVLYLVWTRRLLRHQARQNMEGVRRLRAGDYAAAAEIFEGLCRDAPHPSARLVFVHNRGSAYLVMGDFDSALGLFTSVLNASGRMARRAMAARADLFRGNIAAGFAWGGELDKAEAILTSVGPEVKDPGAFITARAVIALRRGDAAEALSVIESGWTDAEALLSGLDLKPLRILWAFTLKTLGRESDEAFAHQRADISPRDAELIAWCGTRWPELATFVATLQASE